jgi:hypothetical protein
VFYLSFYAFHIWTTVAIPGNSSIDQWRGATQLPPQTTSNIQVHLNARTTPKASSATSLWGLIIACPWLRWQRVAANLHEYAGQGMFMQI